MDFYDIRTRSTKNGVLEIYPDFRVGRSKDLMVRGKSFYAIWDEAKGLWSTDEYDVARLVDQEMVEYKNTHESSTDGSVHIRYMSNFGSKSWLDFKNFLGHVPDSAQDLDSDLTFSNTEVNKNDYRSKRLPYPLEDGDYSAFDELLGVLYDPQERAKLEWSIGSIIAGDAKYIQKFCVLYGGAGTGKSTFLNIVQELFTGYCVPFEAKAITGNSNAFSTEVFKSNPLVAVQHDGDLSRIEDNTKLNSIISHEEITLNEKYKPSYAFRINCFLFMGTNRPVKITDAKSGIIRRLIDVNPSGNHIPSKQYQILMSQVKFELGAIAYHCLEVYREMGKNYYATYRPLDMMFQTDPFLDFVEDCYDIFKEQDYTTLNQAFELYKTYISMSNSKWALERYRFREELKNYFETFSERTWVDDQQLRSVYRGFKTSRFKRSTEEEEPLPLTLDSSKSLLDDILADQPAQYANAGGTPSSKWSEVSTVLADLDTRKLHYVKPPENQIVVDFDLRGTDGLKSAELNLEAASKWPPTYAEYSKSGAGIHLHYNYQGDPTKLSRVYSEGIEIKVFTGNSSLRRQLTACNDIPIANLNGGLPLKEDKVINFDTVRSEKALRELINRNLNKEIHPGTKPSIDFIDKILSDAYSSDLTYDVSDLRPKILAFANNSTNHSEYCVRLVTKMHFYSEGESKGTTDYKNDRLIFFDCEVFPNLFIICWKYEGDKDCVKMINPSPEMVGELLKTRLVGFNCRKYDNHILYARYMGYNNEKLYMLSQKIIANSPNSKFAEAYSASYTDVYDFSSKKQSLKKFEIELGIHHQELGLPWDEPVPEDKWTLVAEYCCNDVEATEAVFNARKADFVAREILASLSGLTVNDTTQKHTAKIIFGDDRKPQEKFVYTDLSEEFPGYRFEGGKSSYKGEDPGEGGYVYSEPGMYEDVALDDIESMHPHSIIALNLFGPYTKNFEAILKARLAIKHGDFDSARKMYDGKLKPYLEDESEAKQLAYALKIAINIVYGLTSAKFDNPFRDIRNVDNIVAKRGALFMIDLKEEVQKRGFTVAHIKTDSIKIPNATPDILEFVQDYGKQYGYTFDLEATYDRMCLVNDAVYIAKDGANDQWTATGAQFAEPYVFKKLFSKEPITYDDLCVTKTVTTALYLDCNENLGEDEHNYIFIGKAGLFCPVIEGAGGGWLVREKEGKYYSAAGAKGYRWSEAETVKGLGMEDKIDMRYFDRLVDEAVTDISQYGDFERFTR